MANFPKANCQRSQRRTFSVILFVLIVTVSVVYGQNGASKRKEANQLAEKVGQLIDLSNKRSVLRFNGEYKDTMTSLYFLCLYC